MYEELLTVKIGDNDLPIRCNIYVLAAIQEEFSTISSFQQKIIGMNPVLDEEGNYTYDRNGSMIYKVGEPKIEAISFVLPLMIIEGIKKLLEQEPEKNYSEIDWKQMIEDFDFNYIEVALEINKEFQRCFNRKKKTMSSKDTHKRMAKKSTLTE